MPSCEEGSSQSFILAGWHSSCYLPWQALPSDALNTHVN